MNLFRSEEHVLSWTRYDPGSAEGTMPLRLAALFGGELFRERLAPDYLLRMPQMMGEWRVPGQAGEDRPFWRFGGAELSPLRVRSAPIARCRKRDRARSACASWRTSRLPQVVSDCRRWLP